MTTFGVWQHQGTVLPSSAGHNPQQPNVIYEGGAKILSGTVFKMWYNDWTGSAPQISYAESTNGTSWTTYGSNPLIAGAGFPRVKKVGSTYYMYTTNAAFSIISVYTSTDGIAWTLQNSSAITLGTSGQWDATAVAQLNIIDIIAGTWYGYYAGYNTPSQWEMGLATSPDGIHWTKGGSNPVITTNGPSNFDWHNINGSYYGWSQVTLPGIPAWMLSGLAHAGIFYPSDIQRFSGNSVAGPFAVLAAPVFCRTQASEGPTVAGGQVADSCTISDGTNLWIFFTATAAGDGEDGQSGPWMINAAKAPNTTFAQLITTYEGIQTFPAFTQNGLALNESIALSDNFTRANENPVSNGGKWIAMGGAGSFAANGQVLNNKLTGTSTTQASINLLAGTFAADQWASITASAAIETSSQLGVVLRASTSAATLYRCYWAGSLGSPGTLYIDCYVNGSSGFPTQTKSNVTLSAGDVLTGMINGNVISVYQNGFLVFSFTDAGNFISATGQPGFTLYGGSTTATDVSATAWAGGNIVTTPPAPPPGTIAGSVGSQVNVYSFTVYLKSKESRGEHIGMQVAAVGPTPAAAQQVLQQQFGSDLQLVSGGILVSGPIYTTLA